MLVSFCNTLSRFVIAFLPRIKHLLISWLQSPSAVILEPKKIKSVAVSTFPPSICCEMMGLDAMILAFQMFSFSDHNRIKLERNNIKIFGKSIIWKLNNMYELTHRLKKNQNGD